MSNDLIAIQSGLPAHLAAFAGAGGNSELTGHGSVGFPFCSIKGKVFTVSRGGEQTVIMSPHDPDAPASSIEVVLIRANPKNSKTYYAASYVEGSDGAPDCTSSDGIKPDSNVENPQSGSCATCPHNVWGSKMSEDGKKLKACQDNVRVAIAAPGQLNDPMLLRVPPASIKPLVEYGSALEKRGVPFYAVVTKLGFDMTQSSPKLTLKAVAYATAEDFEQAKQMRESDLVQSIIGLGGFGGGDDVLPAGPAPAHVAAAPAQTAAPAATPAPAPTAATVKPAAKKAAAKPAAEPAAPAPAPKVQATDTAAVSGVAGAAAAALAEVEAYLSTLDGTDD